MNQVLKTVIALAFTFSASSALAGHVTFSGSTVTGHSNQVNTSKKRETVAKRNRKGNAENNAIRACHKRNKKIRRRVYSKAPVVKLSKGRILVRGEAKFVCY